MRTRHHTDRVQLLSMLLLATLTFTPHSSLAGNGHKPSGRLMEQLTQFNGGCPPNECEDVRFSIHRAPLCANGPNNNLGAFSTSMVREFAGSLSGGSSTLIRAEDGLAFSLTASGLRANSPYTIWWVGFNPDNECIAAGDTCTCSVDSLRPGADSVFYATGAMTDSLGTATFAGSVDYGDVPAGFDQVPFGGVFGVGMRAGAEVHFVIRGHGPALRGGRRHSRDVDD